MYSHKKELNKAIALIQQQRAVDVLEASAGAYFEDDNIMHALQFCVGRYDEGGERMHTHVVLPRDSDYIPIERKYGLVLITIVVTAGNLADFVRRLKEHEGTNLLMYMIEDEELGINAEIPIVTLNRIFPDVGPEKDQVEVYDNAIDLGIPTGFYEPFRMDASALIDEASMDVSHYPSADMPRLNS